MAECEQPAVALAAGEAQPSPEVRLADAMATHQAGKLAEAEVAYRALLAEFPDDTNATHLLGVVRFQSGAPAEGLQLVQRSLEADPANAHAWNNLGNMYVYLKRKEEAEAAYRRATTLDGAAAPALYNLGLACLRRNELEQGLTHLRAATRARPRFVDALHTLTLLYYRLGRPQEACDVYRQWAEEDPGNPTPRHMLAASSGRDVPERCEEGHIVRMFDNFADEFEEKLRQLDYCGPQLVAMCLVHHPLYQSGRAAILDAGCGTGWCGPLLKSTAGRLVGVDLSPKMLERARSRGVYDELHEGELTAFMSSHPASFDVIASADVLIYFGKLDAPLRAAHDALRPGGLLCFSVEALLEPASGEDYRLQVHGRCTHSRVYLERALATAGFPAPQIFEAVVRLELSKPVQGYVASARLPDP